MAGPLFDRARLEEALADDAPAAEKEGEEKEEAEEIDGEGYNSCAAIRLFLRTWKYADLVVSAWRADPPPPASRSLTPQPQNTGTHPNRAPRGALMRRGSSRRQASRSCELFVWLGGTCGAVKRRV
jgi:hypothetical protein